MRTSGALAMWVIPAFVRESLPRGFGHLLAIQKVRGQLLAEATDCDKMRLSSKLKDHQGRF